MVQALWVHLMTLFRHEWRNSNILDHTIAEPSTGPVFLEHLKAAGATPDKPRITFHNLLNAEEHVNLLRQQMQLSQLVKLTETHQVQLTSPPWLLGHFFGQKLITCSHHQWEPLGLLMGPSLTSCQPFLNYFLEKGSCQLLCLQRLCIWPSCQTLSSLILTWKRLKTLSWSSALRTFKTSLSTKHSLLQSGIHSLKLSGVKFFLTPMLILKNFLHLWKKDMITMMTQRTLGQAMHSLKRTKLFKVAALCRSWLDVCFLCMVFRCIFFLSSLWTGTLRLSGNHYGPVLSCPNEPFGCCLFWCSSLQQVFEETISSWWLSATQSPTCSDALSYFTKPSSLEPVTSAVSAVFFRREPEMCGCSLLKLSIGTCKSEVCPNCWKHGVCFICGK